MEIRQIISTTNLIENLNGIIRKYTKPKLSYPSDDAVKESVLLAIQEIEKKWTMPVKNWGIVLSQFKLSLKTESYYDNNQKLSFNQNSV